MSVFRLAESSQILSDRPDHFRGFIVLRGFWLPVTLNSPVVLGVRIPASISVVTLNSPVVLGVRIPASFPHGSLSSGEVCYRFGMGLHQGLTLSLFLLGLVIDRLTEDIRQEPPLTMMFVILQGAEVRR